MNESGVVLRVWSSGGLRLEAGGVELQPPPSRRARAVLAYLALHPGSHARAQLADRFWPDVLDESAMRRSPHHSRDSPCACGVSLIFNGSIN
jgi:hypothetical protein